MKNYNKICIDDEKFYTVLRIGKRIVFAPNENLKKEQKYFLCAIKKLYPYKTNILECAKIHKNKKWILKLDIKDFFDSVPQDKIHNVIQRVCRYINKEDEFIKYYILTTLKDKLPQGAVTSAHIANAAFTENDKIIKNICYIYEADYTRYVDDLTFSADNKEKLKIIEKRVSQILSYDGYKLNRKKTKYISDNKQQNVLGLVVNDNKVRISNDFKRTLRAMFHKYFTMKADFNFYDIDMKEFQRLRGYLSYIKQVDLSAYYWFERYIGKLAKKYSINS